MFPAFDCGACLDACPVKIDIPRMLVALRVSLDRERVAPWSERLAFKALARVLERPRLFRALARLARPLLRGPLARLARPWTDHRALPHVARRSFTERRRELGL